LDENLFFNFITNFVWSNGGFELIYFIPQLLYIIGISKHISVASTSDTSLNIIKLEINYNYVMDAFKKPHHSTFFVFKFNFPCGSHFMAYFKR
jgi:hypothetical protein